MVLHVSATFTANPALTLRINDETWYKDLPCFFVKRLLTNLSCGAIIYSITWGYSSVGQSASLTSKRSPVRTQIVPPNYNDTNTPPYRILQGGVFACIMSSDFWDIPTYNQLGMSAEKHLVRFWEMDLKKIRILSAVSSSLRERWSCHLTAWRDSYPVNKADRIGGVDRRNCDPYKQDGGLQRGDTASVTRYRKIS